MATDVGLFNIAPQPPARRPAGQSRSPRAPQLGLPPSRRLLSAVGGKTARTRVAVLLAQASRHEAAMVRQSAVQEIALLASFDGSMRAEIILAKGDFALVRALKSATSEPVLLKWLLVALSHLAVDDRTRQRQNSAVPRMVQLLDSHVSAVAEASAQALLALAPSAVCRETLERCARADTLSRAQALRDGVATAGAVRHSPRDAPLLPLGARANHLVALSGAGSEATLIQARVRGRATRERFFAAREFRTEQAERARARQSARLIQARSRGALVRVELANGRQVALATDDTGLSTTVAPHADTSGARTAHDDERSHLACTLTVTRAANGPHVHLRFATSLAAPNLPVLNEQARLQHRLLSQVSPFCSALDALAACAPGDPVRAVAESVAAVPKLRSFNPTGSAAKLEVLPADALASCTPFTDALDALAEAIPRDAAGNVAVGSAATDQERIAASRADAAQLEANATLAVDSPFTQALDKLGHSKCQQEENGEC